MCVSPAFTSVEGPARLASGSGEPVPVKTMTIVSSPVRTAFGYGLTLSGGHSGETLESSGQFDFAHVARAMLKQSESAGTFGTVDVRSRA